MTALAVALACVLLVLAGLHAYWGLGGIWPGNDAASCARTVAGFQGVDAMPGPIASFAVAAALCFSATVALVLGGVIASPFPFFVLGPAALFITLVFLGRGVVGFTPAWRRLTPEMPFARLDRFYYSPLCLLIGAAFFTLGIRGFSA
ncbi:DUF3995 domain-containing protein [Mesorhizobium sp. ZMM04-5]|uniref:DUF3995 domain-containing protein n=1 Tax=Mesorhizobium marinum TaxID=3228790 RepID=A0ABV3R3K9_9HYPH